MDCERGRAMVFDVEKAHQATIIETSYSAPGPVRGTLDNISQASNTGRLKLSKAMAYYLENLDREDSSRPSSFSNAREGFSIDYESTCFTAFKSVLCSHM